jgi:phenol 2-monooxygenase
VERVCDGNPVHLGHHARADGRWRVYVFADAAHAGEPSAVADLAEWMSTSPDSPLAATPAGADPDAWFDVKVIYQQDHTAVDLGVVPQLFLPRVGPFGLIDYEKVYAADPSHDIFAVRGIDRGGAIVVVRPDQYVAHVLPLTATDELAAFFRPILATRELAR